MPDTDIDYLMKLEDREQVVTTLLAKLMDRERTNLEYDEEFDDVVQDDEIDRMVNELDAQGKRTGQQASVSYAN